MGSLYQHHYHIITTNTTHTHHSWIAAHVQEAKHHQNYIASTTSYPILCSLEVSCMHGHGAASKFGKRELCQDLTNVGALYVLNFIGDSLRQFKFCPPTTHSEPPPTSKQGKLWYFRQVHVCCVCLLGTDWAILRLHILAIPSKETRCPSIHM